MNAYTFLDVETPNRRQDCICSIGLQRTDAAGRVEYERHFYVDPQQGFDPANIAVHGITPARVQGCPTFSELWQAELADVLHGSIAVAHYAPFDLSVLNNALSIAGLPKPKLVYLDTCDIARGGLSLPNYKLPTVCAHYGVALRQHHDALTDAEACRGIFWAMDAEFGPLAGGACPWVWEGYDPRSRKATGCDAAMTDLYGIVLGVFADGRMTPGEEEGLRDWMQRNGAKRDTAVLCDAFELLDEVLEDGIVTSIERERILNLTRPFIDNGHNSAETMAVQKLIGYLRGVSCDRRINARELRALRRWVESSPASDLPEFARVRQIAERVLEDGRVSGSEEAEVLEAFDAIVDPASQASGGGLHSRAARSCSPATSRTAKRHRSLPSSSSGAAS